MIEQKLLSILDLREGITVIVITGGPCSGKTTGLARLRQLLADRGYKVLVVPESATKLIGAGVLPGELETEFFQESILLDTLWQQQLLFLAASEYHDRGNKVVVLCDRGTMDGQAYMPDFAFTELITRRGYTHKQMCDERCHAVIHLRTAALGAEEFYTLDNNAAREETPDFARTLDQWTLEAWMRHPHPRVIDNSTDFDGKLRRLFAEVCAILGDPVPLEKEDKFLIEQPDIAAFPVTWNESSIVQSYLTPPKPDEEHRIRARSDRHDTSYFYTIKQPVSPGVRVEKEKMISQREYETLQQLRDPGKFTIKKRRVCFFWREQFFEVDIFEEPREGLALMEAERTDRTPELDLPPFIKVIRNVTGDSQFSNVAIAAGK